MIEENDKPMIKENNDGSAQIVIKDMDGIEHHCNLFYNREKDFKQNFKFFKTKIKCNTVISSLITAVLFTSIFYLVDGIKNSMRETDEKKIEDEKIKNSLEFNIDNADKIVVKKFFDEALTDLEAIKDNNQETLNIYNKIHSKLILLEKENDYLTAIIEGSKLFSEANIYFGVGKYEKYLNAKNINGEVYFPLETAIPSYSEEELVGNIIITYLPNDTTPYVSESELEEFKKSKEIKSYINKL